jgi:hypothetical protein
MNNQYWTYSVMCLYYAYLMEIYYFRLKYYNGTEW